MRPVFLISIPAVQKVFNSIIDASAQRLTDKVGHIPVSILGALAEDLGKWWQRRLILILHLS